MGSKYQIAHTEGQSRKENLNSMESARVCSVRLFSITVFLHAERSNIKILSIQKRNPIILA
jgi:hypothetical protein